MALLRTHVRRFPRGVTPIAEHTDDGLERALIQRTLAAITTSLAACKAATEEQLSSLAWYQRRFPEVVADLEMSHQALTLRTQELEALKGEMAPLEVVWAMCEPAGGWQPVTVFIDGVRRSILVPTIGREDHLAASRWWQAFKTDLAARADA